MKTCVIKIARAPAIPFRGIFGISSATLYPLSMLAGVAGSDITPPVGTPLQGHYSLHPQSTGVLAPLQVRTIALRSDQLTLLLITADLIGVDLAFTNRIRTQIFDDYAVEGQNILIAASHTHCGPAMLDCIGLTPKPKILDQVERAILKSVADALTCMEPVTLGLGASSAHFNVNRRPLPGSTAMVPNDSALVDRRARILRVELPNGQPLAVLFHYSCHPTVKNGSDGFISPDYPGLTREQIESALSCRALFLPGCFGNIRPNIRNEAGNFTSATVEQLWEVSNELSDAICRANQFTRTFDDDHLSARQCELFLPFASMPPAAEVEQMTHLDKQPLRADWAKRHLAMALEQSPGCTSGASGSTAVTWGETSIMQLIRVGPLAMVAIPGEPVQEIGHAIERAAADIYPELWPVGYANDQLGYLCTPRMYAEGGYEPTAYVVYDRPAPYHGEAAAILQTAEELMREKSE